MTAIAFVTEPAQAESIVAWAGKFAAASGSELIIFYVAETSLVGEVELDSFGEGQFKDETLTAVSTAIEGIVRTKRARKGRLSRHAVSLRRVVRSDPTSETIARVTIESPDLFIGAYEDASQLANGKSVTSQVASRMPCDTILLTNGQKPIAKPNRITVATCDGPHCRSAIDHAAKLSSVLKYDVTVVGVEENLGQGAIQVAERQLRTMLKESDLQETNNLSVKALLSEDWVTAIGEESSESNLLLVGSNMAKRIAEFEGTLPNTTIGLIRRAPRLTFKRKQKQTSWLLPQINPTDYADLYEHLQSGSRWNSDFIVMLSLAAGIATLGLLQSSPAVVIGSMLLAPLMTPMIGMGLALNQGNAKLAYASFRAIGRGFLAGLFISIVLALVTPGADLTPEIFARTEPNILDLLIALFSGSAAAYALARPSLAGTIAGVAIATALVPPLCSTGISLAYGQYHESIGAFSLLFANVLAIILAAAATFRAMGLSALTEDAPRRFWVRHVVGGLTVCVLAITIPLSANFMRHVREGKNAPIAFAITNEVREVLLDHVSKLPDVEIIYAGRSGVHRDSHPVDMGIILSSKRPLSRSAGDDIVQLLRDTIQDQDLRVRVECVVEGWADEVNDSSVAQGTEPLPK